MSTFLYLYGFVPEAAPLPAAGLAGIADSAVELLPLGGFSAAVSRVLEADFAPEVLEQRTRELAWVGAQGVAHETVVAWFVDHSQILPVPLFTLYSSDQMLAEEAQARRDSVAEALRRFEGLREWDLKVSYLDAELARHGAELSPEIAELDRRIAAASAGTRFLLERKREDLVRTEVARAARARAGELLELAEREAERVRTLPVGRTEGEGAVVLNAAALVPSAREQPLRDAMAARAAELAPLGIAVVYSGPWAPYRFLAEPQEEPVG